MRYMLALIWAKIVVACGPVPDAVTDQGIAIYADQSLLDAGLNMDLINDVISETANLGFELKPKAARRLADQYDILGIHFVDARKITCGGDEAFGCSTTFSMTIAVQDICPLQTVAHEWGHWLAYRFGDGMGDPQHTDAELFYKKGSLEYQIMQYAAYEKCW